MGYKIGKDEYQEARENLQADPLNASGKFKCVLNKVDEVEVNGFVKTIVEFKVTSGEHEGKVQTQWLQFKQEWEELNTMEDKERKRHYAAVNFIEKLSLALNAPVQDVVEDLAEHIGTPLGIKVESNQVGDKTYYNIREIVALEGEPKQKAKPVAEEISEEIPF